MGLTEKLFGQKIPCGGIDCGRDITDSELTYLERMEKSGRKIYIFYHLRGCIENEIIRITIESGKPIYAKYPVISRERAVGMLKNLRLEWSPIEAAVEGNK